MPRLVSERIKKLREEIAEISEANRTQMHKKDTGAAADQRRDWRTDLGEAALPDLALITARLHLPFASSARRCCPCPRNRRAYLSLLHPPTEKTATLRCS